MYGQQVENFYEPSADESIAFGKEPKAIHSKRHTTPYEGPPHSHHGRHIHPHTPHYSDAPPSCPQPSCGWKPNGLTPQQEYYNSFFDDVTSEYPHRPTPMCNPPYPYYDHSTLKDYRVLENHQDPGQISLRQNINVKHVRVENNSQKDVLVGIHISTNGYKDPYNPPKPQFLLRGGEVRDLGVNMPGERLQYIWLFDPKTKYPLSDPHAMHNHMNQFVVIEGQNRWWVMDFQHKGYRPQF